MLHLTHHPPGAKQKNKQLFAKQKNKVQTIVPMYFKFLPSS